jgi:hypothetical protein
VLAAARVVVHGEPAFSAPAIASEVVRAAVVLELATGDELAAVAAVALAIEVVRALAAAVAAALSPGESA